MSKKKLSFSLILALFLVGMLSTAAFAKDPYGLKPVSQSNLSLLVPFTGNTADPADYNSGPKTYNAIQFDVVLKDSTGTIVGTETTYQGTISTVDGKASITIPAGTMTPSANYTVELYKTTDVAHGTLLSKSTAVVLDPKNTDMYKANPGPTDSATVDVDGNGMHNSNLTGYNNTRKQKSGQKVHGFYQNNTNSCASCHQTHTAANGESLLFKDGVYSTCSACHDGTTGAYNSFAPTSAADVGSIVGTFNVQTSGHNGSLHEADGSLQVSAAPGGNTAGGAQFGQEFDCASCHAAHGSGTTENNLNMDPLGWASVAYASASTGDQAYGRQITASTIYTEGVDVPATKGYPYILVKRHFADKAAMEASDNGYFYKRANITVPVEGIDIVQMYSWKTANHATKYMPDNSLWLREKGYPYKADTKFWSDAAGTTEITSGMTVAWKDGFAYGTAAATIAKAQLAVGIEVETTSDIATLYDTANANYVPESGLQMSNYCSRCHTDYLSITRTDNTGVYTQAHRHQTATDSLTCVRCHYGHGSEATIMKDANDQNYYELTATGKVWDTVTTSGATQANNAAAALSYFVDPNPSSALKRYTGMSVCYACHGQGSQFLGNANNISRPQNGQPGTTRTQVPLTDGKDVLK